MGMTVREANEILGLLLRGGVYVSLHGGAPGEEGSNEVEGGGYRRQSPSFTDPADGAASNLDDIDFELLPESTISHIGLWDRREGGGFRWSSPLDEPMPIRSRGTFRIVAGDLTIQLRPAP